MYFHHFMENLQCKNSEIKSLLDRFVFTFALILVFQQIQSFVLHNALFFFSGFTDTLGGFGCEMLMAAVSVVQFWLILTSLIFLFKW